MAKYFGKVGFVETMETAPGVWEEVATEREYSGDVIRDSRKWEGGEHLNDNLNIGNTISLIPDDYAIDHFFALRYIYWMGTCWKINTITFERPRITITIGGVYNGNKTWSP